VSKYGCVHWDGLECTKDTHSNRALEDYQHYDQNSKAQAYADLIKDFACRTCSFDLRNEPILHYNHSSGWPVEGYNEKQWLFITCPKCGYQNALWKLGVSRSASLEEAE